MTERTMHEERYFQLLEKDGTSRSDVERQALFYILAHQDTFHKINAIYDFKEHWIKADCFEVVDFSGGVRNLQQLRWRELQKLFNSN